MHNDICDMLEDWLQYDNDKRDVNVLILSPFVKIYVIIAYIYLIIVMFGASEEFCHPDLWFGKTLLCFWATLALLGTEWEIRTLKISLLRRTCRPFHQLGIDIY